jgi:hypothetical protein
LIKNGDFYQIVGIHLFENKDFSFGINFDEKIRKTINSWIHQASGHLNLWSKNIDCMGV